MTISEETYTKAEYGAMIRALNQVHYAGETSFYGSAGLRPVEEALIRQHGRNTRILDVGCGAGRVTRAVSARGLDIRGVDVNSKALDVARGLEPGARFVEGSMADLPMPDHSFDQVWCLRFSFNALPTEAERLATLRELWRVCAPGGRVYIEAFNWYFPGRLGLIRLANSVDAVARRLKWHGQGRQGSLPLPPRDIIYVANKASAAAPGFAHLTTVRELRRLANAADVPVLAITSDAGVASGRLQPVGARHGGYATWLVLSKEVAGDTV